MKKTALVLGLFVFALNSCDKQDPLTRPRYYHTVLYTVKNKTSKDSQKEKSHVQLHNIGVSQISFSSLQETFGKIDIANYVVDENTQIVMIETLNHNVSVKGFNKMIDNFSSLYATDNVTLMKRYQLYADENCKKIYGCVGTVEDGDYDWKIIKFLPNSEKCTFKPTITMSNVMLYK